MTKREEPPCQRYPAYCLLDNISLGEAHMGLITVIQLQPNRIIYCVNYWGEDVRHEVWLAEEELNLFNP